MWSEGIPSSNGFSSYSFVSGKSQGSIVTIPWIIIYRLPVSLFSSWANLIVEHPPNECPHPMIYEVSTSASY